MIVRPTHFPALPAPGSLSKKLLVDYALGKLVERLLNDRGELRTCCCLNRAVRVFP
jgi:hypothetical protein